ncbi:MAG: alanine--tRNA ligase-related protein, partial [Thermofilum sp.]
MEEEFLNLPFFVENGWIKKTCKVCGRTFWTLDPDREVCGDQPCEEYSFIGERVGAAVSSPSEVRARFIDFFSRRGHTPVRRYPVVARWREDVYLVGASIYDFQPWVTEGVVPPPANPLVISQPSIRLTDLENVGRTGRHFTGFEMMAHHAFNIGGINVYWANETVEYAYELFTKSYGVNPREITFIFDVWSGGGNAGEDYEVIVRGLEVATLVFMHYRVLPDGSFSPMRNRIVDTGYGLERIYWLLTGSFNAYESVFQPFITYL